MKIRLSSPSSRYGARRALCKLMAAGFLALALPGGAMAEDAPEIMMIGDSITQGYGLNPGEGLVDQLRDWLAAQGVAAHVVNAGVSGDTTAGGRERMAWSLGADTDAVIVELGGNDMLRGLPPAQARDNLDAMLAEARGRGLPVLLVGLAAPGNYGPAYQAEFDAIWPDLAARHGALLLADLFAPITALPPEERAARELMQHDAIHPAPAGVALIVAALGPKVQDLLAQVAAR
jgi:acyl-CoA thioesterase-1